MMRLVVLSVFVASLVFGSVPALAGDEEQARIAALEAELKRRDAEMKHLREAYDKLTDTATRSQRAVAALTNSLTAMRQVNQAQQQQVADLQALIEGEGVDRHAKRAVERAIDAARRRK